MAGGCDHRENKSFDRHRPGHIEWPAIETGDPKMSAKVIVSYDGTANEDDAVALGRLFAQPEALAMLERGAQLLGNPAAGRLVVTDRSTPEGLASLAEREGADVIVF